MKGHKWFAAIYDRMSAAEEKKFFAAIRQELIHDVSGEVLEIGAGTGLNFQYYPKSAHVIATEPDPYDGRRSGLRRSPLPMLSCVRQRRKTCRSKMPRSISSSTRWSCAAYKIRGKCWPKSNAY